MSANLLLGVPFLALLLARASISIAEPPKSARAPLKQISDPELLAYVRSNFNALAKMGTREVLGINGGAVVVVDFPCSDLCPDYTHRIIHYDVANEDECKRIGGVVRQEIVPVGVTSVTSPFCLPKVVAEAETPWPR